MSWSELSCGPTCAVAGAPLPRLPPAALRRGGPPRPRRGMRAIEVAPINDRIGHYLGDDLITDLNGTGQTASPPKYRLTVTVSLGTQTPTVNSEINAATSATVTGDANYTLTKVDGGAQVLTRATPRLRPPTIARCSATTICAPRATPRSASPARFRPRFRCALPRRSRSRAPDRTCFRLNSTR